MADAKDHVDVVYLPYLPLKNRATVGDWELIPSADLRTADCLDERAEELARGLGEMYVLPRDHRTGAGAFARPRDGHVGDDARDMQSFGDLRRACVAAVLDPNPDPTLPDDQKDWNAGDWRRAGPRLVPTRDLFCCNRAAHVPRRGADDEDGSFAASERFALQSQDCWSLSSACLFARFGGSRGQMALDAAVGH